MVSPASQGAGRRLPLLSNEPSVAEHFGTYGNEEEIRVMFAAKVFLEGGLRDVRERLLLAEDIKLEGIKRLLSVARGSDAASASAS